MSIDFSLEDVALPDVSFSFFSAGAYTVSVAIFFNQRADNFLPRNLGENPGDSDPEHHIMVRDLVRLSQVQPGWWRCTVPLPPGWYEYLFLVDCRWTMDPEAPMICPDGAGGFNAARIVEPLVTHETLASPC